MNGSETERRRDIARRIVQLLTSRTALGASIVTGSVATGTADEYSDIDLLNYYAELPDPAYFGSLLAELGGGPIRDISPPNDEGFGVQCRLDGVEVQTGGQLIAATESRLAQIEAGDVDWIGAKIAEGILLGEALHGAELIEQWKQRARYPESLRMREVEANVGWLPIWALDEHLAARDAELFRRQMLLDGAYRVLAVLSAVNRLYFTSFQFKRARSHIERMSTKPDRLAERLDLVANAPPSEAAEELRHVVEETKGLVRQEMPEVDVDRLWRPELRKAD